MRQRIPTAVNLETTAGQSSASAVPTCLAKECLSATLDRTKLVSRPVPVRGQVRFRSALAELLLRQGEALGPNSWNGTSLTQVVYPAAPLINSLERAKCLINIGINAL